MRRPSFLRRGAASHEFDFTASRLNNVIRVNGAVVAGMISYQCVTRCRRCRYEKWRARREEAVSAAYVELATGAAR